MEKNLELTKPYYGEQIWPGPLAFRYIEVPLFRLNA